MVETRGERQNSDTLTVRNKPKGKTVVSQVFKEGPSLNSISNENRVNKGRRVLSVGTRRKTSERLLTIYICLTDHIDKYHLPRKLS